MQGRVAGGSFIFRLPQVPDVAIARHRALVLLLTRAVVTHRQCAKIRGYPWVISMSLARAARVAS